MACPGAPAAEARIIQRYPNLESSSPAAEEGSRAHALAEILCKDRTLPKDGDQYDTWHDREMLRHAMDYRDYCYSFVNCFYTVMIEERFTMPAIHKNSYGTADFVAFDTSQRHCHVIDFKYGRGQFVEVKNNPQALQYAEGARQWIHDHEGVEIQNFTIHIFQPRAKTGANINKWHVSRQSLATFVAEANKAARLTDNTPDVRIPGDKQCLWCAAQGECPERAAQVQGDIDELLPDLDTATLTSKQLGKRLESFPGITRWMNEVKAMAFRRAMDGEVISEHKLVAGRASYKPDPEKIEFILGTNAFKDPQLKSKTDIQNMMGRPAFESLLSDCYRRTPGHPTLVGLDDKREAWQPEVDAKDLLDDI